MIPYLVAMYLAIAGFVMGEQFRRPLTPSERVHSEAHPLVWWSCLVGLSMVWPLSVYFLSDE